MDQKQKEKLRVLLKARKRANSVLAKRREVDQQKLDRQQRLAANQELRAQYTQELTALAQESGVLAMSEQAALQRGGSLAQEMSCYVDYGLSSSCLQQAFMDSKQGKLRASHLALRITWEESGELREAEIQVHKNGQITFHNNLVPVFPFLWRSSPQLLQKMLASALNHPRKTSLPVKQA